MIKDIDPLLKECEETLAEVIKMGNMEVACYVQGFINSINKLPDAEQRPHGEWKAFNFHIIYCNNCGMNIDIIKCEFLDMLKFCPNCGADMRKENQ